MLSPITTGPLAGAVVGSIVVTAEGRLFPVTLVTDYAVWFGRESCALPTGHAAWPRGGQTTVRLANCAEAALYRDREREKAREAELLATATKGMR